MREICIVPTYQREELLWLCLEAIRAQASAMELTVIVFSDRGDWTEDLERTKYAFNACTGVVCEHNYYGNSFNILDACKRMLTVYPEAETIHLIEDDTILHPGYFTWARGKLGSGQFAAVCGHIGNEQDTWYTSPCASWQADKLRQCLEIIPLGYHYCETREGMQKALDESPHFAKSKFKYGSAEQDGFLLRCIEKFGWHTKFPDKPLCTHLGSHGYNRPTGPRPEGNLHERIAWYRKLLIDTRRRYELFGTRITDLEMSSQ